MHPKNAKYDGDLTDLLLRSATSSKGITSRRMARKQRSRPDGVLTFYTLSRLLSLSSRQRNAYTCTDLRRYLPPATGLLILREESDGTTLGK